MSYADVPSILVEIPRAELDRLRAIEAAAVAHVAQLDANDKHVADCEAIGSSPSSMGSVRAIKTLEALRAALIKAVKP